MNPGRLPPEAGSPSRASTLTGPGERIGETGSRATSSAPTRPARRSWATSSRVWGPSVTTTRSEAPLLGPAICSRGTGRSDSRRPAPATRCWGTTSGPTAPERSLSETTKAGSCSLQRTFPRGPGRCGERHRLQLRRWDHYLQCRKRGEHDPAELDLFRTQIWASTLVVTEAPPTTQLPTLMQGPTICRTGRCWNQPQRERTLPGSGASSGAHQVNPSPCDSSPLLQVIRQRGDDSWAP